MAQGAITDQLRIKESVAVELFKYELEATALVRHAQEERTQVRSTLFFNVHLPLNHTYIVDPRDY